MTNRFAGAICALAGALALAAVPVAARAQEFIPPDRRPGASPGTNPDRPQAPPDDYGLRFDLIGFSTRGGVQVNKDQQAVLGSTLDLVQLWAPQVRLRPSFEVGFGRPATSLAINTEVIYRFQPDNAPAIPYLGLGVGYYDDASVKRLWPTMVMGFELPFRRTVNWLIEYHALDALRRSRFMVGLATRNLGR